MEHCKHQKPSCKPHEIIVNTCGCEFWYCPQHLEYTFHKCALHIAAPDLLEACQSILEWFDGKDTEPLRKTSQRFEQLKQAIAKAT